MREVHVLLSRRGRGPGNVLIAQKPCGVPRGEGENKAGGGGSLEGKLGGMGAGVVARGGGDAGGKGGGGGGGRAG